MTTQNTHITRKVVIGYIILILMTAFSIWYLFDVFKQVTKNNDNFDSNTTKKVFLITNTLSLIHESETLGILMSDSTKTYLLFEKKLNMAHNNMDSLKNIVENPVIKSKIDSIKILIKHKRWNMIKLLDIWKEANTERLYSRNIERMLSFQDTTINVIHVKKNITMEQDSVAIPPKKKRGFFKRLAEAFNPPKIEDAGFIINSTKKIVADTLLNSYNPSDTIVRVLKSIQDSVTWQRQNLSKQLISNLSELQNDNTRISQRINQLLRYIENEEVKRSLNNVQENQLILKDTLQKLTFIAIASIIIVIFFLILIINSIKKSQYYRKQLEKAKANVENLLISREKVMLAISHDIRAPLSSILGFIELMERLNIGERQAYYLNNMRNSSNHILSLVNDLIDSHRLDSGKMEINAVSFQINEFLFDIYQSFKPIATAKGLNFIYKSAFENNDCFFWGDTIRIRQIISNLLSNAIKFTIKGEICFQIATKETEQQNKSEIQITVKDDGPGISDEEKSTIFNEFSRLKKTDHTDGFGLGLSITYRLVQLMGGTIRLNSTIGKGSEFIVLLPLKKDSKRKFSIDKKRQTDAKLTISQEETISCLLVDDDLAQLEVTKQFLNIDSIQTTICSNPNNVMNLLENNSFEIVFTDIQMPGYDGYKLLHSIRQSQNPQIKDLPVIALSADISKDKNHFINSGFNGFLNKPFTSEQLITVLNKTLNKEFRYNNTMTLDFNSFLSFAENDREAAISILNTFIDENRKNLTTLIKLIKIEDKVTTSKIAHKMIPLFTMLGTKELVTKLKKLENDFISIETDEWKQIAESIIKQVKTIMNEIENKITES